MKIDIIESVSSKSGTGIRLKGIKKHLSEYHDVHIRRGYGSIWRNPDLIIASKPLPHSCIPSLFNRTKVKAIDYDDAEADYWKGHKLSYFVGIRFSEWLFPRFFDFIITHNERLKNHLIKTGIPECDILLLPQGIDFNYFQKNDESIENRIRKKFELFDNKVVLFTGHLGPAASGLCWLMDNFKAFNNNNPNTKMLVIGSGSMFEIYYNASCLNIRFNNQTVEHSLMPYYFNVADCLVNYLQEKDCNVYREPIKTREALASGTPVVTNSLYDNELDKFCYVYNDEESFKKMLYKALFEEDGRTERGREFVKKNYDWGVIIPKFNKELIKKYNSHHWEPYSVIPKWMSISRGETDNILKEVRDEFPENCRVLDVGSGIGRISAFFKQLNCDVTAIDSSPEMVRLTSEQGINSMHMNAENLNFGDKTFDIVITDGLLEHFDKENDIEVILAEEARVGKTVVNIVPRNVFFNGILEKVQRVPKEYRRPAEDWIRLHKKYFKEVRHKQLMRLDVIICR